MFSRVKRFMILSTARSGSNYLVNLINSNSSTTFTYGELFNLNSLTKDKINIALKSPVKYLIKSLRLSARHYRTVGFKIFYYHATKKGYGNNNPDLVKVASKTLKDRIGIFNSYIKANYEIDELTDKFSEVWRYLREKDFDVVHLKRKNLLKSYVSLKKAYITDQWTSGNDSVKGVKDIKINLSYKECSNYFNLIKTYERKYDLFFKNHNIITVYYEDLVSHKKQTINRLEKFLSIKITSTDLMIKKQEGKPLSEVVLNYQQLKRDFLNSKWNKYFEE